MPMPCHQDPTPESRWACAPYTFVPLAETVVPCEGNAADLPRHDALSDDAHTGWLDVTIRTRSPLYIRGPMRADEVPRRETDEVKKRPDFFHTGPIGSGEAQRPVLPGSSLRGMLRAVVEAASAGKMSRVTDRRPYVRSMDGSSMGNAYVGRMREPGALRQGFLRPAAQGGFEIVEVEGVLLHHSWLNGTASLYEGTGPNDPNRMPWWQRGNQALQYVAVRYTSQPVTQQDARQHWFPRRADGTYGKIVDAVWRSTRPDAAPSPHDGVLVLGGPMKSKTYDYIFPMPTGDETVWDADKGVTEALVERFNDDDQITQWQQKAFPTNEPARAMRARAGHLGTYDGLPGTPVFFLVENGAVTFVGRTRMFRLPAAHSPYDLLPAAHRNPATVDVAEALFGFVRTDTERAVLEQARRSANRDIKKAVETGDAGVIAEAKARRQRLEVPTQYAGRVTVSDGTYDGDLGDVYLDELVPPILSSPKPSSFQLYLTQDTAGKNQLRHYSSPAGATTLRGFKRYFAQGLLARADLNDPDGDWRGDQRTRMRPVRAGVDFTFRVHFTGLSDVELGALVWALRLPGDKAHSGHGGVTHVHRLGMGKPFGMGAVSVEAVLLTLVKADTRYGSLSDSGLTTQALGNVSDEPTVRAYESYVAYPKRRVAETAHGAALLALLRWPGFHAEAPGAGGAGGIVLGRYHRPNTRYLQIENPYAPEEANEYKSRRVLPSVWAWYPANDPLRPR